MHEQEKRQGGAAELCPCLPIMNVSVLPIPAVLSICFTLQCLRLGSTVYQLMKAEGNNSPANG